MCERFVLKEKTRRLQQEVTESLPENKRISLNFGNSWLHSFKKRNGSKRYPSHGESADAYEDANNRNLPVLQDTLKQYALRDMYNADEFALFYRLPPTSTIGPARLRGRKKKRACNIYVVR